MTETVRPARILARGFLQALQAAGILHEGDYVRRVVIDAQIGDAVIMYVERYGDSRLLDVATTLDGVEIRGVPAPADTADQEFDRAVDDVSRLLQKKADAARADGD